QRGLFRGLALELEFARGRISVAGSGVSYGKLIVSRRILGNDLHVSLQGRYGFRVFARGAERHPQRKVGLGKANVQLGGAREVWDGFFPLPRPAGDFTQNK